MDFVRKGDDKGPDPEVLTGLVRKFPPSRMPASSLVDFTKHFSFREVVLSWLKCVVVQICFRIPQVNSSSILYWLLSSSSSSVLVLF